MSRYLKTTYSAGGGGLVSISQEGSREVGGWEVGTGGWVGGWVGEPPGRYRGSPAGQPAATARSEHEYEPFR